MAATSVMMKIHAQHAPQAHTNQVLYAISVLTHVRLVRMREVVQHVRWGMKSLEVHVMPNLRMDVSSIGTQMEDAIMLQTDIISKVKLHIYVQIKTLTVWNANNREEIATLVKQDTTSVRTVAPVAVQPYQVV